MIRIHGKKKPSTCQDIEKSPIANFHLLLMLLCGSSNVHQFVYDLSEVVLISVRAGELLGGEDRIDQNLFTKTGDSLIGNFGSEYWTKVRSILDRSWLIVDLKVIVQHTIQPRDFTNW
jgi:hypothetical protein